MIDAPRITPSDVAAKIAKTEYLYHGLLTMCVLTLQNGFLVVGHSACVSTENYNQSLGEKYAYEKAFERVWDYEGYLLREQLHCSKPPPTTVRPYQD